MMLLLATTCCVHAHDVSQGRSRRASRRAVCLTPVIDAAEAQNIMSTKAAREVLTTDAMNHLVSFGPCINSCRLPALARIHSPCPEWSCNVCLYPAPCPCTRSVVRHVVCVSSSIRSPRPLCNLYKSPSIAISFTHHAPNGAVQRVLVPRTLSMTMYRSVVRHVVCVSSTTLRSPRPFMPSTSCLFQMEKRLSARLVSSVAHEHSGIVSIVCVHLTPIPARRGLYTPGCARPWLSVV